MARTWAQRAGCAQLFRRGPCAHQLYHRAQNCRLVFRRFVYVVDDVILHRSLFCL